MAVAIFSPRTGFGQERVFHHFGTSAPHQRAPALRQAPSYPFCPSCGRLCAPAASWPGSIFCRGLILLDFVAKKPGQSAWELSQASGIAYSDVSRALLKLRHYNLVTFEAEERDQGRQRYRYFPAADQPGLERFQAAVERLETMG
jgi:hypothetical protein